MTVKMTATMGKKTAKNEPTIEVTVSKVATKGLAIPAVAVVEAKRVHWLFLPQQPLFLRQL